MARRPKKARRPARAKAADRSHPLIRALDEAYRDAFGREPRWPRGKSR